MRKDFINYEKERESELDFIENYWSSIWEGNGFKNVFNRVFRQEEYKLIKKYLAKLNGNSKILDGGCGLGDWVVALKTKGYEIFGVDISKITINKLNNRFPEIEFKREDIRNTSFKDELFDIYFSWGVFEHFEEGPQQCLVEAKRILKKNGILCITVPFDNLRQSYEANLKINSTKNFSNERFYQYRFSISEISRELKNAGFEIIKLKPIHKRQGTLRMLHHNFGLNHNWFLTKVIAFFLSPFFPSFFLSHMLFAAAIKK